LSISAAGTPQEKIIAAIRTTAIRLDVPLASFDTITRTVRPFGLNHAYLITLINLVNEKFHENEIRKQKLFNSLQELFSLQGSVVETKEERRVRKRMEGLQLQASQKASVKRQTHKKEIDIR
jgi:tRNA(Phe) wybutosine-synthesizing methylase Tyw3